MANNQIPVDKLTRIREALPYGSGIKLATEFGVSHQYVYAVLRGKRNHKKIIFRALEMIKEEQEMQRQLERSIDQSFIESKKAV